MTETIWLAIINNLEKWLLAIAVVLSAWAALKSDKTSKTVNQVKVETTEAAHKAEATAVAATAVAEETKQIAERTEQAVAETRQEAAEVREEQRKVTKQYYDFQDTIGFMEMAIRGDSGRPPLRDLGDPESNLMDLPFEMPPKDEGK